MQQESISGTVLWTVDDIYPNVQQMRQLETHICCEIAHIAAAPNDRADNCVRIGLVFLYFVGIAMKNTTWGDPIECCLDSLPIKKTPYLTLLANIELDPV